MPRAATLALLVLLALAGGTLVQSAQAGQVARQVQFGQWAAGEEIVFDYRVVDFGGAEKRITFRLAKTTIAEGRALIRPFRNHEMAATVEGALRDYLRREAPDVEGHFEQRGNSVEINLEGRDHKRVSQVMAALEDVYHSASAAYLQRLYMREIGKTIYLDYTRLAQHYVQPLKGLAESIGNASGGDERDKLALALAFFQTMPYDALTDHDVSNGIDFIAPPVLLNLNRGDCDSKAVALGAVLHSMLPNRKTIIVLLPQHAIVGIDLAPQPGERTLSFEGRTYVLMETAGPATFAIGALFPQTDAHVKARRIDQIFPL
jgi:hypothetical protein